MILRRLMIVVTAVAMAVGLTSLSSATANGVPDGTSAQRAAAERTVTVRYGPYTLPAATEDEHGEIGNRFAFDVEKPCDNCYITGVKPNLVYEDGSNANVNTGPMLHHMVLLKGSARDVTCDRLGQRIFASGNERVESVFPDGYGIKVDRTERWSMLYDLMNHAPEEKKVYISVTYTYRSAFLSSLKAATPIWMDAGGCTGSEYDAPEGVSEKTWQWTSTISGELVHMRGHLHHGGTLVRTENLTSGEPLCEVVAEEGGTPEFIDLHGRTEISDMPPCSGDPLGTVRRGDVLRITSRYELTGHSHHDVMGIMVGWIARS